MHSSGVHGSTIALNIIQYSLAQNNDPFTEAHERKKRSATSMLHKQSKYR